MTDKSSTSKNVPPPSTQHGSSQGIPLSQPSSEQKELPKSQIQSSKFSSVATSSDKLPLSLIVCKNCSLKYKGYYCPRCGQAARTARFTARTVFTESIFSSLDLENGLLHTIKQLILRPGPAIREYIEGRRATLYIPTRFLVLVGALTTFISLRYSVFRIDQEDHIAETYTYLTSTDIGKWYQIHFKEFWEFANEYNTLINILSIPIFSIFSFLLLVKKGYNYAENLILNVYIVCMQLSLLVVFILPLEIFSGYKAGVLVVYTLLAIGYNVSCYMCIYGNKKLKSLMLSSTTTACAYACQFIVAHSIYYAMKSLGIA